MNRWMVGSKEKKKKEKSIRTSILYVKSMYNNRRKKNKKHKVTR